MADGKALGEGGLQYLWSKLKDKLLDKQDTLSGDAWNVLQFDENGELQATSMLDITNISLVSMDPYGAVIGYIGGNLTDYDGTLWITGLAAPTTDDSAVTKAYADAQRPLARTVTLTADRWSNNAQTVTVSGVLADETRQLIQPVPAAASQAAYIEAGILCTGQAADSLTFTAETAPTADLTVFVTIQEVRT